MSLEQTKSIEEIKSQEEPAAVVNDSEAESRLRRKVSDRFISIGQVLD